MSSENQGQEQDVVADMSTDEAPETPVDVARPSPGALLGAQRETLELTIQQVADKLNLTMHYVRCLESDSYEKLPGDVFVRGYIRSYANLLQLDPVQVLTVYDEFNSKKQARKEEAIKRHARRRKDKNRPWIIVSGVAFVGVALALWYFNAGTTGDTAPSVAPPASSVPASTGRTEIGNMPVFDTRSVSETPVTTSGGAAADEMESAPQLQADLTDNTSEPPADTDTVADAVNLAGETVSDDAPVPSASNIVLDWSGEDSLLLTFSSDSWVEIEDRSSGQAHRDLRVTGDSLMIRGTAPFAILLGNARAATLTFNGRVVDISANIRADDTARLSIGM